MRAKLIALITTGLLVGTFSVAQAHGNGADEHGHRHQLAQLRKATAPYHRVSNALADGYTAFGIPPSVGGTATAGLGLPGDPSCFDNPAGGMGVHYVNGIDGVLDPTHPEALVYSVGEHGRLHLVAVEYIVPDSLVDPTTCRCCSARCSTTTRTYQSSSCTRGCGSTIRAASLPTGTLESAPAPLPCREALKNAMGLVTQEDEPHRRVRGLVASRRRSQPHGFALAAQSGQSQGRRSTETMRTRVDDWSRDGVGRRWLANQAVPADEWRSIDALLRQLDFHGDELAAVEHDIAVEAIDDPVVARLMTVPGIDVIVAVSIVAAVGDFSRFSDANRLVSYLGLNPSVRQSGNGPAVHGRITKAGRAQARGMIVEAAFSASRAPGPLRAFYRRINDRRGFQVATVATARKMTALCWHLVNRAEDYAFARPSLTAHKRRKLELAAGATSRRGPSRGATHDYHVKQLRDQERAIVEQHERAYEVIVAHWQPRKPAAKG